MENEETYQSFLGSGWSFPPEFDASKAEVKMLQDEDDIASSIEILLSTAIGERIMQPRYGCRLNELMFEPMNNTMQNYLKNMVEHAILIYEPRISLNSVSLDMTEVLEGKVIINVDYTIISTNSRDNMVYPFYFVK